MRKQKPLLKIAALLAIIVFTAKSPAETILMTHYDKFDVKTKTFDLSFQVGPDARLYQIPVGGKAPSLKNIRDTESYPQAGDGYVWEPALELVHADGNTSTTLRYVGITQTNESPDIELTRVKLRDPAYPLDVTLCFRTHAENDVVEQWIEI